MAKDSESFKDRVDRAMKSGAPLPDFPETSPLQGLAMAQNEAVNGWQKAGFSRGEALYLVACMFCGNPGQSPAAGAEGN